MFQDAVTIVGAAAILAGGGGFIAGIAGAAIGAINFMDRNDWDLNKMKDSIKNGIDSIRGDEQSINNLNDNENKEIKNLIDNIENPLKSNPFPNGTTNPNPLDEYGNPLINLQLYDPLTLDLNNDGKISTLNLSNGVYFDHNKDGVAFKTSWIGKEDGILVLDKNSNNKIDNGNELFGNFTEISNSNNNNKTFAINGFHALKKFDTNRDNTIDMSDDIFKELKLWQDKNSNGLVDKDELFTLEEKGIKSINLNHKMSNEVLNKDSIKELTSTFTKTIQPVFTDRQSKF